VSVSGLSCATDTHPNQVLESIRVTVFTLLAQLPGVPSVSIHYERDVPRYGPSGNDVEQQIHEPCFDVCDWRASEREEASQEGHVDVGVFRGR